MSERIGTVIGEWFYKKGKIEEDKVDHIRYAIEIVCSEFLEMFVIVSHSILSGKWIESLCFIVFLLILRNEFQGFHAKTIVRCFIITISVYLLSISISTCLNLTYCVMLFCIDTLLQVDYCIHRKAIRPMTIKCMLYVFAGLVYAIMGCKGAYQLLVITELFVSLSLIPERRKLER